jgi:microcystin-dependent protein
MSIQTVDNYFPFTSGPGAAATVARWRLMARNWVVGGSGVLALYLNQCIPSLFGSTVTVGTGAVWADGFYGEIDSPKTLTISGNGMVVARMDPVAQVINVVFVANQTVPTQTPTGIYEVPIAQVTGTTLTDLRALLQPTINLALPTGMISPFAGPIAPVGWLICNGNAISRAVYATLFGVIGTTYGFGDNATTFNVPDLRSRAPVGSSTGTVPNLTQRGLGATGGAETVGLTPGQNGQHNHWTNTGTQSAQHIHGGIVSPTSGNNGPYGLWAGSAFGNTGVNIAQRAGFLGDFQTGNASADHSHGIQWDGTGAAHENMPPWLAINMMIKT